MRSQGKRILDGLQPRAKGIGRKLKIIRGKCDLEDSDRFCMGIFFIHSSIFPRRRDGGHRPILEGFDLR